MARTKMVEIDCCNYPGLDGRWFSYSWNFETEPLIGQLVLISFRNRQSLGLIRAVGQINYLPKSKILSVIRPLDLPPLSAITLQMADWLKQYYAASSKSVWQTILPSALAIKKLPSVDVSLNKHFVPNPTSLLNQLQQNALSHILKTSNQPTLLYGITGSGKTRLYEALMEHTLSSNKSIILLAPEIVLATFLQSRLAKQFGDQMSITHSGLTATKRRNVWINALHRKVGHVYMGPRSALFLPVSNLGLIIIDEEHDSSYKQDQQPRFQTNFVAGWLAKHTKSQLVLGSATPALQTLALCQHGSFQTVHLPERVNQLAMPIIRFVKPPSGGQSILSPELQVSLKTRLDQGEQSLILHNQRGSARRLICIDCATIVRCHKCDTAMVFHADLGRLMCHLCNHQVSPPAVCQECGGNDLHYSGFGTKSIVELIADVFPTARIDRLDRDSRQKNDLELILKNMHQAKTDILIGTQMIAKGLDFPNLTLVGILAADELIAGADFTAAERGVSLIMQTAGRPGRRDKTGEVIIQTLNPANPIWSYVVKHDWTSFANQELRQRKLFHYPPYRWMVRLVLTQTNQSTIDNHALDFGNKLRIDKQLQVLGPAQPSQARLGLNHRRQIVIMANNRQALVNIALNLPPGWTADLDPIHVL